MKKFQGLDRFRVIDLSNRIAGHYCSKMFVDAGAEVIKIESAEGDPLRQWSATRGKTDKEDAAFFRYLNAGKKSLIGHLHEQHIQQLIQSADLLIETYNTGSPQQQYLDQLDLRHQTPQLVHLAISAYGRHGPYARYPSTEFTLQADSGSLCMRGRRDQAPVQAGGKITEYVGGTFAAVAALAATLRARENGMGEFIDFSLLEVFNIAGTNYSDMMSSLWGRPDVPGILRNVEVPSIEPTQDGWVGFATNSFQQYSDFLVLIGRPDLLEQQDLANAQGRSKRMDEWNQIVHQWTKAHTTADIIETAALLRIPVAPVNNGQTVFQHEQLQAREVFVENPAQHAQGKTFQQPRPPYLINGRTPFPIRPAPLLGQDQENILPRRAVITTAVDASAHKPVAQNLLPLAGIRVLDATAWWAGPSATQMLAHLGAEVIHLEAIQRPDGSRMMGGIHNQQQNWYEYSAMFLSANTNKLGLTLNLDDPAGVTITKQLLEHCDVFIENYSPRVIEKFGLDWDTVHGVNDQTIMVRMPAFGLSGPWKNHVGFAQTMEQISGMAWLTGHPEDQPRIQRGPCDPMAGMNAAFATLLALHERKHSGKGCLIESPMVEGALNAAAEQIVEYSAYGHVMERMGNRVNDAAPQGLYACAHHERKNEQWLALSIENDAQWQALQQVLGQPPWISAPELRTLDGRHRHHDLIDQKLSDYLQNKNLQDILQCWSAAGIPVAPVRSAVKTHLHPQNIARGFFETLKHPATGKHLHVGMPLRYRSLDEQQQAWLRCPAPLLGQHNRLILQTLLQMDDARITELERSGVIGTVPSGLES